MGSNDNFTSAQSFPKKFPRILDLVFGDVSPYSKFIPNICKQKDAYVN